MDLLEGADGGLLVLVTALRPAAPVRILLLRPPGVFHQRERTVGLGMVHAHASAMRQEQAFPLVATGLERGGVLAYMAVRVGTIVLRHWRIGALALAGKPFLQRLVERLLRRQRTVCIAEEIT